MSTTVEVSGENAALIEATQRIMVDVVRGGGTHLGEGKSRRLPVWNADGTEVVTVKQAAVQLGLPEVVVAHHALQGGTESNDVRADALKVIRHVRDTEYWHLPYGTPLIGRGKSKTPLSHLTVQPDEYDDGITTTYKGSDGRNYITTKDPDTGEWVALDEKKYWEGEVGRAKTEEGAAQQLDDHLNGKAAKKRPGQPKDHTRVVSRRKAGSAPVSAGNRSAAVRARKKAEKPAEPASAAPVRHPDMTAKPDGIKDAMKAAKAGDKVTISVPGKNGISHHVFTLAQDGRWHKGSVDRKGSTHDEVLKAYDDVRKRMTGVSIRMGDAPGPFANGGTLPKSTPDFNVGDTVFDSAGRRGKIVAINGDVVSVSSRNSAGKTVTRKHRANSLKPITRDRHGYGDASESTGGIPAAEQQAAAERATAKRLKARAEALSTATSPSGPHPVPTGTNAVATIKKITAHAKRRQESPILVNVHQDAEGNITATDRFRAVKLKPGHKDYAKAEALVTLRNNERGYPKMDSIMEPAIKNATQHVDLSTLETVHNEKDGKTTSMQKLPGDVYGVNTSYLESWPKGSEFFMDPNNPKKPWIVKDKTGEVIGMQMPMRYVGGQSDASQPYSPSRLQGSELSDYSNLYASQQEVYDAVRKKGGSHSEGMDAVRNVHAPSGATNPSTPPKVGDRVTLGQARSGSLVYTIEKVNGDKVTIADSSGGKRSVSVDRVHAVGGSKPPVEPARRNLNQEAIDFVAKNKGERFKFYRNGVIQPGTWEPMKVNRGGQGEYVTVRDIEHGVTVDVPVSDLRHLKESDYGPVGVGDRVIVNAPGGRSGSARANAHGQEGRVTKVGPKNVTIELDDGRKIQASRTLVEKNNSGLKSSKPTDVPDSSDATVIALRSSSAEELQIDLHDTESLIARLTKKTGKTRTDNQRLATARERLVKIKAELNRRK